MSTALLLFEKPTSYLLPPTSYLLPPTSYGEREASKSQNTITCQGKGVHGVVKYASLNRVALPNTPTSKF